ncbi:hypothetical protein D915_002580 [Fasciola hepatica]|uniref:Uncharacterized protein n=1 Tax=Fasciola hepatica TaxID=6192 RepID=A0A4E0RG63_FASHE|nr:hypothetical protein D915_002580 [Fasciola hepatica]
MSARCTPTGEELARTVLQFLIPTVAVGLLLTAVGNSVAAGVLLFSDLESVLSQVSADVEAQYKKPTVDFSSQETIDTYYHLLSPMVHVIFWHQVAIMANQLFMTASWSSNSKFLMHSSMFMMAALATCEILLVTSWTEEARNEGYYEVLMALKNLITQFQGADSVNLPTLLFNYIQANFHCCGIFTFTEWYDPQLNWTRTAQYGINTYELRLPISCCPDISSEVVPSCALSCATDMPWQVSCAEYFSNRPLFRITWIPESSYAKVYLLLHLSILLMYVAHTVLQGRHRRVFYQKRLPRQPSTSQTELIADLSEATTEGENPRPRSTDSMEGVP